MSRIHPTAVIDPGAQLHDSVAVGAYTIIGPEVEVDEGTTIGSHCVIEGATTIGKRNRIFHHCTLGQEPQDLKFAGERTTLEIGDDNDIREHCTLHVGTANGGGATTVGNCNLIMVGAHIAHDSHIASHCVLANNVMLAGHILIGDHAVVGGATGVTQYVTIGRYAYIGGLSGVVHDCPPFMVTDGHPAHVRSANLIGLARHRFAEDTVEKLKTAYKWLYRREQQATCAEGLAKVKAELTDDPYVAELCRFVERTTNAPNGRHAETTRRDDKRRTLPR